LKSFGVSAGATIGYGHKIQTTGNGGSIFQLAEATGIELKRYIIHLKIIQKKVLFR
jgi:hemolysin (fragment)